MATASSASPIHSAKPAAPARISGSTPVNWRAKTMSAPGGSSSISRFGPASGATSSHAATAWGASVCQGGTDAAAPGVDAGLVIYEGPRRAGYFQLASSRAAPLTAGR